LEALLRKYLWAIDLVVIAFCAVFLARAASSAVESAIVVPPQRAAFRPPRPQAPVLYTKEVEPILKRNIFCSTCPPIIGEPKNATDTSPKETAPEKTALPLALVAIMYAPPTGIETTSKWSVAVVRDTEDKSMGAYGAGDKVHNAKITEIQETRIYLDNGGKTEYLDLLDGTKAQVATAEAPPSTPPPSQPGGGDAFAAEMAKGIKKTGEHSYEIQRRRWSRCWGT
jgi:hypothetical protein